MKKSILLFTTISLLITSSFNFAYAQDGGSNQALPIFDNISSNSIISVKNNDNTVIGSPYLVEEFMPVKISTSPTDIYKARYNAYDDEIEVKIGENNIQNLNKKINNLFITFLNGDLKFTSLNYINGDDGLNRGYMISLTDTNQNTKLYLKKQIRHVKAKSAASSYDKDKPAEFKNSDDTYFISINDAYARELPKNKKDIAKFFPNNSKDVLNFIKKNKIKTSREADLIQLINYVNSL